MLGGFSLELTSRPDDDDVLDVVMLAALVYIEMSNAVVCWARFIVIIIQMTNCCTHTGCPRRLTSVFSMLFSNVLPLAG